MYDYQISGKRSRIRHEGDIQSVLDWVQEQDATAA